MALLSSASCVAQRMAAHTLRLIQPSMGVASASIVEPVLQLLRNLNVDVQHEGIIGVTCYIVKDRLAQGGTCTFVCSCSLSFALHLDCDKIYVSGLFCWRFHCIPYA